MNRGGGGHLKFGVGDRWGGGRTNDCCVCKPATAGGWLVWPEIRCSEIASEVLGGMAGALNAVCEHRVGNKTTNE